MIFLNDFNILIAWPFAFKYGAQNETYIED